MTSTPGVDLADSPPLARREILVVLGGLMTAVLLAALDVTVMATALPTIAGGFGGLDQYAWVVTAYLLTSTASMPLYGSLSDMYGRLPALRLAVVVFLIGSVLCGAAQSMDQLILFRAVQGLGAGGLMVLAITIVSDLVPTRDRARYQGLLGAVFGVASVAGPLLGGLLTEHNWRWIFLLNLPLGAVALVVTDRVLRRLPQHRRPRTIDYLGALILVAGASCLLLLTTWGGTQHAWTSPVIVGLAVVSAALIVLFVLVERNAREPLLPLRLFRRRTFALANATGFFFGMVMFGVITYTPMYLQVVKAHSPTASGLLMVPMMGGVVVASIAGGRLISWVGRFKWFTVAGATVTTGGVLAGMTLRVDSGLGHLFAVMLLIGIGMGLLMQPLIVAIQHGLARSELGAGTAAGAFLRQLGGSFGVAILGAVLAGRLANAISDDVIALLREPERILALPDPLLATVRTAVVDSLQAVFAVAALFGAVCVLLTVLLPDHHVAEAPPVPSADRLPRGQ
jgi:EmrB/QacA subfamily drug resistance transporter